MRTEAEKVCLNLINFKIPVFALIQNFMGWKKTWGFGNKFFKDCPKYEIFKIRKIFNFWWIARKWNSKVTLFSLIFILWERDSII